EDGHVTGMRFERTRLNAEGDLEGTGEMVDYELGAVYRAVGYHGSELPGIPYDARRGVIPNTAGRITAADGTVLPGLYANGPTRWVGESSRINSGKASSISSSFWYSLSYSLSAIDGSSNT